MIVVVGAGMAGLQTVVALRAQGYAGPLTLVGAEPEAPYDRPPLSKQVLAGRQPPDAAALDVDDLGAEWRLGERATALDVDARRVTLAGGEALDFDGLVIATGAAPRRIPGWPDLDGVHVLRTLDDSNALRAALTAAPRRLVVVGAGFIGCEVAATARALGVDVALVEPLPAPCVRALGEEMGAFVADLHRAHGVDVRLGAGVAGVRSDGDGVAGVELDDGTAIDADVVVVGIGVAPVTDWLAGSGLDIEGGVVCDATCAAAPGVVAAGDVARWYHAGYGETIRVEHWDNAVDQGAHAGRTLLAHLTGGTAEPYTPVPWFWSDQYDRKLQMVGRPAPDCTVDVVEGSVDDGRFVATYTRAGEVTAVLGVNMPARVIRWRADLAAKWV